jgi:hypothetical protein
MSALLSVRSFDVVQVMVTRLAFELGPKVKC